VNPASALAALLERSNGDPLVFAGLLLAIWVPICAVLLGVLALVAGWQNYAFSRKRFIKNIPVPPPDVRPLAMRRYATAGAPSGKALGFARVLVAVAAVALFTAFFLAANGPMLLTALRR
jgi:hypothetical protein